MNDIVITRTLALISEIKALRKRKQLKGATLIENDAGYCLVFHTAYGDRTLAATRDPYYPKYFKAPEGPFRVIKEVGVTEIKVLFSKK